MSLLLPTSTNTAVPNENNRSAVYFLNLIKIFVGGSFFEHTSRGLLHSEHFNVILILGAC